MTGLPQLGRALEHAAHLGFPWVMGGGDGMSPTLRRALRRSVVGLWPPELRWAGQAFMALLWPFESFRDALVFSFRTNPAVLGGRNRLAVALRAWGAALGWNLPPIDYLTYRLYEPGRPGPGHWLHSADAHRHFSALAAPELRALAGDKLAFAEFGEAQGAPVMAVLASYGRSGPDRPFAGGLAPQVDLLVKPRWGHGGHGQTLWRWDGERHAVGVGTNGFTDWLLRSTRGGDVVIQAFARPPATFGAVEPSEPPLVTVFTAEWPDRRRAVALATVMVAFAERGETLRHVRQVDLVSGAVLPPAPPLRPLQAERYAGTSDITGSVIGGWDGILAVIDRLHAALPGPGPVLKWDVLLTDEGPRILELNTGPSAYGPQSVTLEPLIVTPIGDALEAWAR